MNVMQGDPVREYCIGVLLGARARIACFDTWLTGYMWDLIRDRDCYCAAGAVASAARMDLYYEGPDSWPPAIADAIAALNAAATEIDPVNAGREPNVDAFITVNDSGHTPENHRTVLRIFDRAIERLRGSEHV